jgi:1-acyl-sn-glycerol-3-phosphate acyltransferase
MLQTLRAILIADPLIVLATVVMGAISWVASLRDRTGRLPHQVARLWARILLFVSGVQVRVEGLDRIQPDGGYVFAANHLSLMDTPLVIAYIPAQFRFLAKRSLFRVPFIGGHLKRAGHIRVDREDPRSAVKVMGVAAELIRKDGISILVFPEGSRSEDGKLQEFKEGAAYLAIKAGVPVVPVAISGTHAVLPPGSVLVRSGKATLRIGHPIPTGSLQLSDRALLTRRIREEVAALLPEADSVVR